MFYFSSFLCLHLSPVHMCARALSLSLSLSFFFWLCVCFSFFKRTLDLPLVGRLDPHVAGLGQGAGPRLLRGSLCLKPLRISYCSSQGAGWGLAEGFLAAASPRVQAAGAPVRRGEG